MVLVAPGSGGRGDVTTFPAPPRGLSAAENTARKPTHRQQLLGGQARVRRRGTANDDGYTHHEYDLRGACRTGSGASNSARIGPVEFSGFEHALSTAKRTLARFASNARRSFVDAMQERQTRAELSSLGDHMLADTGVERD